MMSLVRLNAKARTGANAFDKEYAEVAAEIELMQERKQKLNDAELEKLIRRNKVEELQEYLTSQDTPLARFDGDLFRRLIEKVLVHSMVEITFVFRSGVEVREILK
jgi:site-specific DNA recombinase